MQELGCGAGSCAQWAGPVIPSVTKGPAELGSPDTAVLQDTWRRGLLVQKLFWRNSLECSRAAASSKKQVTIYNLFCPRSNGYVLGEDGNAERLTESSLD